MRTCWPGRCRRRGAGAGCWLRPRTSRTWPRPWTGWHAGWAGGNRKGVAEKANHSAAQRWWRTLPDDAALAAAQQGVDALAGRMDRRRRVRGGQRVSVAELAAAEPLRPVPVMPFPAEITAARTVTAQALVAFRGNSYPVPPGLGGTAVTVTHRLGSTEVVIATASGAVIARHRRIPDGAGVVVRDGGHMTALEKAVLMSFSAAPPCRRKEGRPPPAAALAEAAWLRGAPGPAERVVIDLAVYAAAATRLQTPSPATRQRRRYVTQPQMSEARRYQQLRAHLCSLKLNDAAEVLPRILDEARAEQRSVTAALERLLDIEVTATGQRRLPARMRFACKTMLAVGLGHAAVAAGYRTCYTTAADLVARCHKAAIEGRWATTMRFFAGPRLLIVDEVGYLPMQSEGAAALFQVITQRYLKGSIALTTNLGIPSWGKIFDDPMVAAPCSTASCTVPPSRESTARPTGCAPTRPTPAPSGTE